MPALVDAISVAACAAVNASVTVMLTASPRTEGVSARTAEAVSEMLKTTGLVKPASTAASAADAGAFAVTAPLIVTAFRIAFDRVANAAGLSVTASTVFVPEFVAATMVATLAAVAAPVATMFTASFRPEDAATLAAVSLMLNTTGLVNAARIVASAPVAVPVAVTIPVTRFNAEADKPATAAALSVSAAMLVMPELVAASIVAACAASATSEAEILVAPLRTPAGALARFAAVSDKL